MSLKILFPASGAGDCIIGIHEDNAGSKRSLMIDCGLYSDAVKKIVKDELNNKIDCLVVTHIDNDHINGVVKLLQENKDLQIQKIIYNGSLIISEDPDEKKQKENVCLRLAEQDPNFMESQVCVEKAVSLTSLILNSDQWKNNWIDCVTTENNSEIDLGGLGRIFVLSPTKDTLEALERQYKDEYARLFYKKEEGSSGSLRELVLRYREKREKINNECEHPIAATIVNELLIRTFALTNDSEDPSLANNASLAFVWEVGEKRILFLGDANALVVMDGLKKYKEKRDIAGNMIIFDAVKVSHHGSSHNTTKELMSLIDSEIFIICGYNRCVAPSLHAIAKIIARDTTSQVNQRKIYLNVPKSKNEDLEYLKNHKIDALPKYEINVGTQIEIG